MPRKPGFITGGRISGRTHIKPESPKSKRRYAPVPFPVEIDIKENIKEIVPTMPKKRIRSKTSTASRTKLNSYVRTRGTGSISEI